ncbi:rpoH [Symbiodinium microadriaticum]|nr:rpoH [Symbiodinium microadriaticum]
MNTADHPAIRYINHPKGLFITINRLHDEATTIQGLGFKLHIFRQIKPHLPSATALDCNRCDGRGWPRQSILGFDIDLACLPDQTADQSPERDNDQNAKSHDDNLQHSGALRQLIRLVIGAGSARIDKVLAERAAKETPDAGLSRSRIKALLEKGKVRRLDPDPQTITSAHATVQPGEIYEVEIPPPEAAIPTATDIPLDIVYEDDDLIVINKPAGLVVHPAPGHTDDTLVNALIHHCGDSLSGIGGEKRPGIVHRIDRDTSGLLVAAKNDQAHQFLADRFKSHDIERAYIAFCWGAPLVAAGTVDARIARSPQNRQKMSVVRDDVRDDIKDKVGRHAVTHYKRDRIFGPPADPIACRLTCHLETGRTHQIRVHMTHIGLPLIADPLYGRGLLNKKKGLTEEAADLIRGLNRQALHAAVLGFEHPKTGEILSFSAPLPDELGALDKIRKFPMLEPEQEYMLGKRWKEHGDRDAAHTLVTSHLRLVAKIASGYRGYGLPMGELVQEGNIGLMQAVKKFEPEKGFRLATYAMWWIKASIQEYVLRSWSLVKLGTTSAQKKLFFNLRKVKNQIQAVEDGDLHPDNVALIADRLNVSEEEVVNMNRRMFGHDQSLNAPMRGADDDGAGSEWQDWLVDESQIDQETRLVADDEYDNRMGMMKEALKELNEREQDILTKRRLQENPATLEDLSQEYDISRERVRQIEVRAFEKLQKAVKAMAQQQALESQKLLA